MNCKLSVKLVFVFILFSIISCKEEEKSNKSKPEKNIEITEVKIIKNPASTNAMQPYLFSTGNELIMSWTYKNNDTVSSVLFSTYKEGKWDEAKEIVKGKDWFINWADFPAIAKNNGQMISHFLQKSDPATFAYNVHVTQSSDSGKTWNKDFKLHRDNTLTEHGFVTILPFKDDSFFITWLDGRNTGGSDHGNEKSKKKEEHVSGATDTNGGHKSKQAMNVRTAIVLKNGEVIEDTLVDDKTCDCCQTSAAITPNGPIIVYRDRTDEEVRDIYISRFVEGAWTEPKTIHNDNWVIKGCPVNGPKADSFKNTLAVAWFTAADHKPKVNLVFSDNNGETFSTPISIDNGKPVGRVDVALLDENNALVSWMETVEDGAEIKIVKVNKNGVKNAPVVVTKISKSRASGFPQFELIDNQIILAWNKVVDKKLEIETASIPLSLLN